MPRLELEPYHEPIGHSPEIYTITRRWVVATVVVVIVLAAGLALVLRPF
ncbi:MAG: hypothetical protein ACRDI0_09695 [Actinomycetota bacterium]